MKVQGINEVNKQEIDQKQSQVLGIESKSVAQSSSQVALLKKYKIGVQLGRGRFANLFQALELNSGCLMAVKQIILIDLMAANQAVFLRKIQEIVNLDH